MTQRTLAKPLGKYSDANDSVLARCFSFENVVRKYWSNGHSLAASRERAPCASKVRKAKEGAPTPERTTDELFPVQMLHSGA